MTVMREIIDINYFYIKCVYELLKIQVSSYVSFLILYIVKINFYVKDQKNVISVLIYSAATDQITCAGGI